MQLTETFFWPVRVYYEDTDAQGIVYYANYFRFMERARTEWLRALGIDQRRLNDERRRIFVVVSTSADFRSPARFNDELFVSVRLESAARASFDLEQTIHRGAPDGECVASGRTRAACLNSETRKPARLPRELLR